MLTCTRHRAGGQHSAVRHCTHSTHSAVWHGAQGVAQCTEQCRAAQRMRCSVVRSTARIVQCSPERCSTVHTEQCGTAHTHAPPPPCPGHGGAACPPGPRAQTGRAWHAWPADMQSRRDSHRAPPQAACEPQGRPSNQIKSNPPANPPPPPPTLQPTPPPPPNCPPPKF